MLRETYLELVAKYTDDSRLMQDLWTEIEQQYTHKKRFYHDLSHLENLLQQLTTIKNDITDWDTVLFTLFYHDVIYNALKKDNEEESAELAAKRMAQLSAPGDMIERCRAQILATKKHQESGDPDTDHFTDADLSVLGQSWEMYSDYYRNVRKEYSIYPDLIYNPGRKKVLQHFLNMERIYKTAYFHSEFESRARENLRKELMLL